MRVPHDVPTTQELLNEIMQDENPTNKLLKLHAVKPVDLRGRYLHWDRLKYLPLPAEEILSHKEYWLGTKLARVSLLKALPFRDRMGHKFNFATPDLVLKMLHQIDKNASGQIRMTEPSGISSATRDTYLVDSFIEEAINSSQLEGASTTREVAKEMIKQNRKPRNRSEQMIFNNYLAMSFIREHIRDELTPEFVYELHRIVTEKTLDDERWAGQLREDNGIVVLNATGEHVLHRPPDHTELPERLNALCGFANETSSETFIHPVIRSILLHFFLAYDHPFVDGNGRTARALFYWSMARQGYWLTEFITISKILKNAPAKYAYAFLYTETDENDTTYFIIHQLKVVLRAIDELHAYLARKMSATKKAVELITGTQLEGQLNYRQISVLQHALKHPHATYRIDEHQTTHRISYQTARTDLLHLSDELKLFTKLKEGRAFVFLAPANLQERIERLKN